VSGSATLMFLAAPRKIEQFLKQAKTFLIKRIMYISAYFVCMKCLRT